MPPREIDEIARNRVIALRKELTHWLFTQALPLWSTTGTDHKHGGFFEKIDRSGAAIDEPRRTRVVGRQIYCFAIAARLGWKGPSEAMVRHGLDYLRRYCIAEDGLVVFTTQPDGAILDERADLYDQAFALFGLAAAFEATRDPALPAIAARLRDSLGQSRSHPGGGYEEDRPRTLPLKANPHMHLFEAALAWERALGDAPAASEWMTMSDALARLCRDHFIDGETGCLREFFDGSWQPMPDDSGRIVEPGHQFEWSWLLSDWGTRRRVPEAIAASCRLLEIGENHGTDAASGLTFNEILDDLSPRERGFRLWPQTERIKAWAAAAERAVAPEERTAAFEKILTAGRGLQKFFAADIPGTWNERLTETGDIIAAPSPASSLYHITCAISELWSIPSLSAKAIHSDYRSI